MRRKYKDKNYERKHKAGIHGDIPEIEFKYVDQKITIIYNFPSFIIDNKDHCLAENKFSHVYVEGAGFYTEGGGKPLLPSFGLFINIPHNCTFESVEPIIEKSQGKKKIKGFILPSQEYYFDSFAKLSDFDSKLYEHGERSPANIVEVNGPLNINGNRALLIHVRPVIYDLKEKILECINRIMIIVKLKEEANNKSVMVIGNRNAFDNLFINPGKFEIDKAEFPKSKGCEFLIIYDHRLEKAAECLANWKIEKGIETMLMSLTKILQKNIPNKIDAIKKYIRDLKKNTPCLRYVLLFGDVDTIPPQKCKGTFSCKHEHVTDFYYSTECDIKTSKDIVFPWLSIGRIPTNNIQDAMKVVKTIIKYEKNPPDKPEYYSPFFVTEDQKDRRYLKTVEKICSLIEKNWKITVERLYMPETNKIAGLGKKNIQKYIVEDMKEARRRVIQSFKEGRLVIGYRGHGTEKGWVTPPVLVRHLKKMVTEVKNPSVIFSINCSTGKFDPINSKDCFSEHALKNGIAASLIAPTCVSNTWHNNIMIKAIYDGIFGNVIPTFSGEISYSFEPLRLGDLLNYSQAYLLTKKSMPTFDLIRHQFEIYHIIGDPTLEIHRKAMIKKQRLLKYN